MTKPAHILAAELYETLRAAPPAVIAGLQQWRPEGRRFTFRAFLDSPQWRDMVETRYLELMCSLDAPSSTFTGTTTRVDPITGRQVVEHYEDGVLLGTIGSTVRDDT